MIGTNVQSIIDLICNICSIAGFIVLIIIIASTFLAIIEEELNKREKRKNK